MFCSRPVSLSEVFVRLSPGILLQVFPRMNEEEGCLRNVDKKNSYGSSATKYEPFRIVRAIQSRPSPFDALLRVNNENIGKGFCPLMSGACDVLGILRTVI